MTATLRCDGCDKTAGRGESVAAWWSLTRYLSEQVHSGPLPLLTPVVMSTTIVGDFDGDSLEPDETDGDLVAADDPDDLHFCTTVCLALWASTAAAVGDAPTS